MATETTREVATELMRTLPAEAYRSPEHHRLEIDRIFRRDWFAIGRAEALAGPGEYLHVDVAGERVINVRARDGRLRGFHDVCRHRGSRLVLDPPPAGGARPAGPTGHFKGAIRCPYHAWTYGLDGALRNAPFLSESDGLRRADLGLYPVAVDVWGGFVFVNLTADPYGPELALRDVVAEPARRTANYALADLRVGASISYDVVATGRSSSRTTTSATTAARSTRSSASWSPRSRRAGARRSTGSGASSIGTAPRPSRGREPRRALPSPTSPTRSGSATRESCCTRT